MKNKDSEDAGDCAMSTLQRKAMTLSLSGAVTLSWRRFLPTPGSSDLSLPELLIKTRKLAY